MIDMFGTGGGGFYDPALGNILATNPELLIPQWAAAGIRPPQSMTPEGELLPGMQESGVTFSTPGATQTPAPATAPHDIVRQMLGFPPANAAPAAAAPMPAWPGMSPLPTPQPEPVTDFGIRPGFPLVAGAPGGAPAYGGAGSEPQTQTSGPIAKEPADATKASGLARALSGVKAPPAPAVQKIDSPRIPGASALPAQSPIVAMLAQALASSRQVPDLLRLGQTIPGR